MPVQLVYLLYGAVFLAAFLAIEGLYYLIADSGSRGRRSINRRLRMLDSGADSRSVMNKLRRTPRETGSVWPLSALDRLMVQAQMMISTELMLLTMSGLFAAGFVVTALYKKDVTYLSFLVGVTTGIVLPLMNLRRRRRKRLTRFGEQFPDALDIIVRSLRVGHPIGSGMALVAQQMPDPVGTEFGITVDEMTYGLDLYEALEHMAERIGHNDLKFMVVAMNIQHGTGGNLAEILDGLSHVIRERFRMFRKIKALSAEGRFSAIILSILPFVIFGAIWTINPQYYLLYLDDRTFQIIMAVGAVIMSLGIYVMYRLVNFRV